MAVTSIISTSGKTGQIDPAHGVAPQSTGAEVRTVRLWINSFIPADLGEPLESGEHAGETILRMPTPTVQGYLTDQRGFSEAPDAPSRMHSEIEIDLANPRIVYQTHRCDPTIEIGQDGSVTCEEKANTDHMNFSPLRVQKIDDGGLSIELDLDAASKNACLKLGNLRLSPNLDYKGTITIKVNADRKQVLVWFKGHVEIYPAFEMYASCNNGKTMPLFKLPPESDSTPTNLFGPPAREVYGEAVFVG